MYKDIAYSMNTEVYNFQYPNVFDLLDGPCDSVCDKKNCNRVPCGNNKNKISFIGNIRFILEVSEKVLKKNYIDFDSVESVLLQVEELTKLKDLTGLEKRKFRHKITGGDFPALCRYFNNFNITKRRKVLLCVFNFGLQLYNDGKLKYSPHLQ